jgi:SAM-dependent methyltransferase
MLNIQKINRKINKLVYGNELPKFKKFHYLFEAKSGLEIGGPSQIFKVKNALPIYALAKKVDGCNFSTNTIWEGALKEGNNYNYQDNKEAGYQFICEGNNLQTIQNEFYDFLLSSHNLEHFANPLKALQEWLRILKKSGTLFLVLPDKRFTFDCNRSITKFEHLKTDFENNTSEHDLTHLGEILELHDYKQTPEIKDRAFYYNRSLKNFENRCLHHHVFDDELLKEIFTFFNIEFLYQDFTDPYHLIMMGRKR